MTFVALCWHGVPGFCVSCEEGRTAAFFCVLFFPSCYMPLLDGMRSVLPTSQAAYSGSTISHGPASSPPDWAMNVSAVQAKGSGALSLSECCGCHTSTQRLFRFNTSCELMEFRYHPFLPRSPWAADFCTSLKWSFEVIGGAFRSQNCNALPSRQLIKWLISSYITVVIFCSSFGSALWGEAC